MLLYYTFITQSSSRDGFEASRFKAKAKAMVLRGQGQGHGSLLKSRPRMDVSKVS